MCVCVLNVALPWLSWEGGRGASCVCVCAQCGLRHVITLTMAELGGRERG